MCRKNVIILFVLAACCFFSPATAYPQAKTNSENSLCVIVDGSWKMVTEKSYDTVNGALSMLLGGAINARPEYSVSVIAIGVADQELTCLPLWPVPPGKGLSGKVHNNHIKRVDEISVLAHEKSRSSLQSYIAECIKQNDGLIVVSDHPLVNLLPESHDKYFRAVLIKTEKKGAKPEPNPDLVYGDIKSAINAFSEYLAPPTVSLKRADDKPVYVGDNVDFNVTGTRYRTLKMKVSYNGLSKDVALSNDTAACTFDEKGDYVVEATAIAGKRQISQALKVQVNAMPYVEEISVTPVDTVKVGVPVNVTTRVKDADTVLIDFGDGVHINYLEGGVSHSFQAPGDYKIKVIAKSKAPHERMVIKEYKPITIQKWPVDSVRATDGSEDAAQNARNLADKKRAEAKINGAERYCSDEWGKAQDVFGQANSLMGQRHFNNAVSLYRDAGIMFAAMAENAAKLAQRDEDDAKRAKAEKEALAAEIQTLIQQALDYKKEGAVKMVETLIDKILALDSNNATAADLKQWVLSLEPRVDVVVKKEGVVGERIFLKLSHANVSAVSVDFGDRSGLVKPELKTGSRLSHVYNKATDYRITVTAVSVRGETLQKNCVISIMPPQEGRGLIWLLVFALLVGGPFCLWKVMRPRPKMTLTFVTSESDEAREVTINNKEVRRLNEDGVIQFPYDLHTRYKSGRADGTNQDGYQLKSQEDLWWVVAGASCDRQRLFQDWGYTFAFGTKYEFFYSELATRPIGCLEVNEYC